MKSLFGIALAFSGFMSFYFIFYGYSFSDVDFYRGLIPALIISIAIYFLSQKYGKVVFVLFLVMFVVVAISVFNKVSLGLDLYHFFFN